MSSDIILYLPNRADMDDYIDNLMTLLETHETVEGIMYELLGFPYGTDPQVDYLYHTCNAIHGVYPNKIPSRIIVENVSVVKENHVTLTINTF